MKTEIMTKLVFFLISMLCFFISCREEEYLPDCASGSCVNTNIKGLLYVNQTGENINNILVEVLFIQKGGSKMLFPDTKKVISGKTDKNGIFNFNVVIDTMFFKDYHLCVRIPQFKDYISSVRDNNLDFIRIWFNDYDVDALQNIHFEFYKKAILTINLNRTQADDCEYLTVTHLFDGHTGMNIFWIPELAQNEKLQVLQRETAADIYTKIEWIKSLKGGERQVYTDSLICKQKNDNIFNINY